MKQSKAAYAIRGLAKRFTQRIQCPSCRSAQGLKVSAKGPYELIECSACHLRYRWPYETAAEMEKFYQGSYSQRGLTTDLPDTVALKSLLKTNFHGTDKDFSRFIGLFESLNIPANSKIMDFGANWGYGVHQFNKAGYRTVGYEISKPRADFANNLDLEIYTDWSLVKENAPYDLVFSAHVLEHTPDPRAAILQMADVLSTGGTFISVFPNGSDEFLSADPARFNKLWGQVHPLMLDSKYLKSLLPNENLAIGTLDSSFTQQLREWDGRSFLDGPKSGPELLFVWKKL